MTHGIRALLLPALFAIAACAAGNDASLLIRDAALVNPETGEVAENQCVRITGQRIGRIATCDRGATAGKVVEGAGKWIIPGLWDMHVHAVWDTSVYPDMFADFVAYGVVGIRDMGGTPEALAAAREFLADDNNVGPELVAAGQVIDGAPALQPMIAISATNHEEGVRAVARLDALGADFIKVYTMLPSEAAAGVFDEARVRGMKVTGHLPAEVDLSDALRLGMTSIEHMAVEIGGLCDVTDRQSCKKAFDEIRAAGAYVTPTLLIRQRPGAMPEPETLRRSRIAEMPPPLAADWQATLDRNRQEKPASYLHDKVLQFERERLLTTIAIESGAAILAGTDTGDFLVPPGSSIHEELELLVQAGMDEKGALLAATARAADFLGFDDRGRIRRGAIADLVILDANPLEDIRNTRRIAAVVIKGRVLDKAQLECIRSATKSAQHCRL